MLKWLRPNYVTTFNPRQIKESSNFLHRIFEKAYLKIAFIDEKCNQASDSLTFLKKLISENKRFDSNFLCTVWKNKLQGVLKVTTKYLLLHLELINIV